MIAKIFLPTIYIKNYQDLDLEGLKAKGCKIFLLDVDNTLISHEENQLDVNSIRFIQAIKKQSIIPVILSNNMKKRVEKIAIQGSCDYFSFALKPLKRTYKKILKKYKCQPHEVVVLGDQLITDVVGGNRMTFRTILQDPITNNDNTSGKITRCIEKQIFNQLEKQNKWRKFRYYDNM